MLFLINKIHTHPHKKQFLLNFVFCFILLFSLNTSLKSVCTSDVSMGGYDLINVGEIKFMSVPGPYTTNWDNSNTANTVKVNNQVYARCNVAGIMCPDGTAPLIPTIRDTECNSAYIGDTISSDIEHPEWGENNCEGTMTEATGNRFYHPDGDGGGVNYCGHVDTSSNPWSYGAIWSFAMHCPSEVFP